MRLHFFTAAGVLCCTVVHSSVVLGADWMKLSFLRKVLAIGRFQKKYIGLVIGSGIDIAPNFTDSSGARQGLEEEFTNESRDDGSSKRHFQRLILLEPQNGLPCNGRAGHLLNQPTNHQVRNVSPTAIYPNGCCHWPSCRNLMRVGSS